MSSRADPEVLHILRLLGERLEAWAGGDPEAFESAGERLAALGPDAADLAAAVAALRALADDDAPVAELPAGSGGAAHRVASDEERLAFGPAAWGFLLELRRRGDLDAGQFERVVDELTHAGVRPVPMELAQAVAARVALAIETDDEENANGEVELPH